jgi:hypothetical protein
LPDHSVYFKSINLEILSSSSTDKEPPKRKKLKTLNFTDQELFKRNFKSLISQIKNYSKEISKFRNPFASHPAKLYDKSKFGAH